MSRLEELIAELCPDGVESVTLEDLKTSAILTVLIPSFKIKKNNYKESGKTPIVSQEVELISGYCDVSDDKISLNNYVCFGDHSEHIKYVDFPFVQGADGLKIMYVDESVISTRYLYHSLLNNYVKHNTYERHFKYLLETSIPLPPPEVQREIVRILDAFTELTAELTAELDARKKQYQYYLDNFFGGGYDEMLKQAEDGVFTLSKLSDVGKLTRGRRFVRDDVVSEGTPCFHYGDLYTHYGVRAEKTKTYLLPEVAEKLRFARKGDVVIVGAGENDEDIGIGVAWFGEDEAAVHDACYIFEHDMNPMYVSYYLRSRTYHTQIKKYVTSGKICAISAEGIGKSLIPVYPLEKQAYIVSILDRFDKLCNEIPAEIEARRKQYEHYRDQLLTFEKKTA